MGDASRSAKSYKTRVAIVGTGPVSLLKALFIAKQNPAAEITLIDSAVQTGGAWYSDYSPKGHLIESGCHIWSYAPVAYHFIETELGVPLVAMKPSPVFVTSKLALPYSLKNTIDTYKGFFKNLLRLRFKAIKEAGQKPNTHYRIFGKKNKYPKTGSPELIQALEKKIKAHSSIKIILNTRISKLEIGDTVRLHSPSGEFIFDKVYLTYVSHVETLILPAQTLTAEPRQVDYIHFLISSDQPLRKKLSYWRLMNDNVVHRITDISYQANHEEQLFLVGIKGDAFATRDEQSLFSHTYELMKSYGLVDENQKFELLKTYVFPTYYMNPGLFKALGEFKSKIEVLHTTDLMYGIHYLLRSEMPHLIKTPR